MAVVLVTMVAGMIGLTFAAAPLYRLFCQVTGYGGTVQQAKAAPGAVGTRVITVRFNADIAPNLPWAFQPMQREIKVRVGEEKMVYYAVWNRAGVFAVVKVVGAYFDKVQCFCFTEQRLEAGQRVEMPVSFFIDPKIADDHTLDDINTITLSYTFFPTNQQLGERRN